MQVVNKIAAGTVLIQAGPVEALYILLDGQMALSVCEDERNPQRAFKFGRQ